MEIIFEQNKNKGCFRTEQTVVLVAKLRPSVMKSVPTLNRRRLHASFFSNFRYAWRTNLKYEENRGKLSQRMDWKIFHSETDIGMQQRHMQKERHVLMYSDPVVTHGQGTEEE